MKILRVLIVFTFLPFLQAQSGSAPTVSQAEEFMKQAEWAAGFTSPALHTEGGVAFMRQQIEA